jgi:hypothetical protein
VGLLLLVWPWSDLWEQNYFPYLWPLLQPFMANDYVRGAVSGLGLLNVVAGFTELAAIFAARDREATALGGPPRAYPDAPDTQVGP